MYKNAVIESLILKRDISMLHDEIAVLRAKLAEHDTHPQMEFVPIESPSSSVAPSPAPSPEPVPTPDPIPPPSPEPEPICEPRLDAIESEPICEPRLAEPLPTRRCVSCAFARTCLKCRTGV